MTRPDFSTRRRPPGDGGGPLLLAGVIAVAAALALAWQARTAERAAAAELARTTTELQDLQRLEGELRAGSGGPASQVVARLLLTAEATPGRLLAALEPLMSEDVRLAGARFEYGERLEVTLDLQARAPAAYDRFLERLAGSPLVEGVTPATEQRDREVRGGVHFVWRGEEP